MKHLTSLNATCCIGPGTLCTQGLTRTLTCSVIFRLFQHVGPINSLRASACVVTMKSSLKGNQFVSSVIGFVVVTAWLDCFQPICFDSNFSRQKGFPRNNWRCWVTLQQAALATCCSCSQSNINFFCMRRENVFQQAILLTSFRLSLLA